MRYSLFSVNDHYPKLARTVPQLCAQVMRSCELAETLGYDTFFCAEHHFHEYGVVPDPAVMLSALAQRTARIRLGTAISILTFSCLAWARAISRTSSPATTASRRKSASASTRTSTSCSG